MYWRRSGHFRGCSGGDLCRGRRHGRVHQFRFVGMNAIQILWVVRGTAVIKIRQPFASSFFKLPNGIEIRAVVLQKGNVFPFRRQIFQMSGVDMQSHLVGGDFGGGEVAEGAMHGTFQVNGFHVISHSLVTKVILSANLTRVRDPRQIDLGHLEKLCNTRSVLTQVTKSNLSSNST